MSVQVILDIGKAKTGITLSLAISVTRCQFTVTKTSLKDGSNTSKIIIERKIGLCSIHSQGDGRN